MRSRRIRILAVTVLLIALTMQVSAVSGKEEVKHAEKEKGQVEQQLEELNLRLQKINSELADIQTKLEGTQLEIVRLKKELKEAKKEEACQYEDMKLRIQFMYENSNGNFLSQLLEAGSFAELLNAGAFIESINEYDRKMLERYRDTKEVIAGDKKKLDGEKKSLIALQAKGKEKQGELLLAISDAKNSLKHYKGKIKLLIAKAEKEEERLEKERQEKERQEKEREEQAATKPEEAEKPKPEQPKPEPPKPEPPLEVTATEQELLAALIHCEAGGESYEGKLAVGSVVVNRVNSGAFPNTIQGVIYQPGQFSPVASGKLTLILLSGANRESVEAAAEVIGGNVTNDCLYFRRNDGSVDGLVIGNHVFY